jgi:hypothetical protein
VGNLQDDMDELYELFEKIQEEINVIERKIVELRIQVQ